MYFRSQEQVFGLSWFLKDVMQICITSILLLIGLADRLTLIHAFSSADTCSRFLFTTQFAAQWEHRRQLMQTLCCKIIGYFVGIIVIC